MLLPRLEEPLRDRGKCDQHAWAFGLVLARVVKSAIKGAVFSLIRWHKLKVLKGGHVNLVRLLYGVIV
jgi:hypothetical protein